MWPDAHQRQGFAIKMLFLKNAQRSNIASSWNKQRDKSKNVTQVQVFKQNLKEIVSIFVNP